MYLEVHAVCHELSERHSLRPAGLIIPLGMGSKGQYAETKVPQGGRVD